MNRCNCRFQIGDMGYYECDLEVGHIGNHSYTHNADSWPRRKYILTWERNEEKDYIFKECDLVQTNLKELIEYIKKNFNIIDAQYNFTDDSIHGSTPILWISFISDIKFEDTEKFYEELCAQETEIEKYFYDNFKFNNKTLYDSEILDFYISVDIN